MIRLIATDLDGTIVHGDGSVSTRTLASLATAEAAGIRVVFVTGRPPRWMADVATATGHRGIAICANGAYVYDLHREQIQETFAMPVDLARRVVERVRTVMPNAAFAVETAEGFGHEIGYIPRWDVVDPFAVASIHKLLVRPPAKLLIRDESLDVDTMLRIARPVLKGIAEVTHSNTNDCLLEVSALGVSKASTLARLAKEWGIDSSEVVAFGDMPNDLEMLKWAGVGYAMANAHGEVLAATTHLAPAIHDDGVAEVLDALFAGSDGWVVEAEANE